MKRDRETESWKKETRESSREGGRSVVTVSQLGRHRVRRDVSGIWNRKYTVLIHRDIHNCIRTVDETDRTSPDIENQGVSSQPALESRVTEIFGLIFGGLLYFWLLRDELCRDTSPSQKYLYITREAWRFGTVAKEPSFLRLIKKLREREKERERGRNSTSPIKIEWERIKRRLAERCSRRHILRIVE